MPKVDFLFCNALTILFCSSFLVIRKKFYNACDLGGGHGDKEGILEGFARNFKLLFCVFLSSRIRFFFVCELSVNFAPIKNIPIFHFVCLCSSADGFLFCSEYGSMVFYYSCSNALSLSFWMNFVFEIWDFLFSGEDCQFFKYFSKLKIRATREV